MTRGTTPLHTFKLPKSISEYDGLTVTYRQNNKTLITKTLEDVLVEGDTIKLRLTAEETLLFDAGYKAFVQIKILDKGIVSASAIFSFPVTSILNEKELKPTDVPDYATASDILSGKVAYVGGIQLIGEIATYEGEVATYEGEVEEKYMYMKLPLVTQQDDEKILVVRDGQWEIEYPTSGTTYYVPMGYEDEILVMHASFNDITTAISSNRQVVFYTESNGKEEDSQERVFYQLITTGYDIESERTYRVIVGGGFDSIEFTAATADEDMKCDLFDSEDN